MRVPPVPCLSWLRCVVWLCVLGFGFQLRPAIPGCGVGVCVFVCVLRVYPNPGRGLSCVCLGSVFGFQPANPGWGARVCVFVCVLHLYPANPGWGVRGVCVCSGLRRLRHAIAGWGVGVCVFMCAPCPYPANPRCGSWCLCLHWDIGFYPANPGRRSGLWEFVYAVSPGRVLWCGCVCLGWGFGCAPPFPAGFLGCVCFRARPACTLQILAEVCGVCVSVLVLAFIRPMLAGVFGCVCLCARSACTPLVLAGVCGAGVLVRVLAFTSPILAGVFGCVCL